MKIYIFTLLTILLFSIIGSGQTFNKKDFVVPKFSKDVAPFDKLNVWQSKPQYKTTVTKLADGSFALNGKSNWTETDFPIMESYIIDELEMSKKKPGKVLLKNLESMILITIPPELDVQEVLSYLLFKGKPEDFVQTDYFKGVEKQFVSKIFTGKLASIPTEAQFNLIKALNYNISAFTTSDFKDKTYLTVSIPNKFVYNTIQVNAAERASRKTQEALKFLVTISKQIGNISGIEGIKITSEIQSKDFLKDKYTDGAKETYEFYVSFSALKKFAEAEITNQELIDSSIILMDGSRVKVDVSSFS